MRKVEYIEKPNDNKKLVEFTHEMSGGGWLVTKVHPKTMDRVIYLGTCEFDGDMFVAYTDKNINIFKGYLNTGIIEK